MSVKELDEWTQDSVWYAVENTLIELGIKIKKNTRKYVKRLIRELCAEAGVTRESIGIIAAPRCTMFFDGIWTSVSFDKIVELAGKGTDIIFIEKLDIVRVLGKYASTYGVALVNSQGHLAEYGKDLINEANESGANLGIFTDDDKHGHMIADEAPGEIVRLGVDDEMLEHFGLTKGGNNSHIDGVLLAVGAQALWDYLQERLEREYPTRDYTRVIGKPDLSKYDPEEIQNSRDIIRDYRESITSDKWTEIESGLTEVNGFIHVEEKRDEIDEELGGIVESDELLKELAAKLAEAKPILDKMKKAVKDKQQDQENRIKERQQKKEQRKEQRQQEYSDEMQDIIKAQRKFELRQKYSNVLSKHNLEIYDIEGVGPTTARKLKEAKIVTVIDLAVADADELAEDINSSKETAETFINAAKKLLEDTAKQADNSSNE